ncbi:hypothetical protein [Mesorhizobium sp. M7A.F.Ca.US.008.03.1.1]|uniref:hypothetical protein n=1 Tax=Mesorhizobium sp. M7A.F.Ca.US.008.03.1.1 TaxID=2496742 RepID=UPI000FC9CACA|nr:hypothetical protein [Mesorhizobium sp. M7A.F.Ca.US.008.03.1.1]RUW62738.1 hypothetical protein EOA16_06585 [Mesorhizobium sp. M7A.F.Ca.US.008.03.1.1]
MANDEEAALGPWKNANLRVTALADAGLGADAGLPADIRFRSSIAKLIRRRLAVRGDTVEPDLAAVFLLMPSPPDAALPYSPKRVPRLDNGLHEINGKLWFVGAGPGSGHFIPAIHADDDDLFTFITDTLGLGVVPAMIFDPRHPELHIRYYPGGLADLASFEDLPMASTEVTIDAVTAAIETTHSEKMVTPDAQPKSVKLWYNRDKWFPFQDAEDRVQTYLEIALNAAFPTCTVRSEQSMPEGRLDIEIIENDPIDRSKVTQHGIIELKVLRTYGQGGSAVTKKYTSDWIRSGVEQAAAYRDSKGAKWGALVCFDMRCDDAGDAICFKHVRRLAKTLEVHLRRWFVYATSKQLRTARAAAKG